jgi:hypothetical protein
MNISNIRNSEKFINGFWDWTPFNECFFDKNNADIGIRISDLDGHVERNGHFVWIEATEKQTLTPGQWRSLEHRIVRGDTALILYGEPNQPREAKVWRPHQAHQGLPIQPCTIERIKYFLRGWMLWAEANGWVRPV